MWCLQDEDTGFFVRSRERTRVDRSTIGRLFKGGEAEVSRLSTVPTGVRSVPITIKLSYRSYAVALEQGELSLEGARCPC